MANKIAAVRELTRMCGQPKSDRLELSAADALAEFLQSIRKSITLVQEGQRHGGARGT